MSGAREHVKCVLGPSVPSFLSLLFQPPHVTPTLINTVWCVCVTGKVCRVLEFVPLRVPDDMSTLFLLHFPSPHQLHTSCCNCKCVIGTTLCTYMVELPLQGQYIYGSVRRSTSCFCPCTNCTLNHQSLGRVRLYHEIVLCRRASNNAVSCLFLTLCVTVDV